MCVHVFLLLFIFFWLNNKYFFENFKAHTKEGLWEKNLRRKQRVNKETKKKGLIFFLSFLLFYFLLILLLA